MPMKDILARVGIRFEKEVESYEFTLGGVGLNYNENSGRLFVEDTRDMNEFGKAMGFKKGDEWSRLNGRDLTDLKEIKNVISDFYSTVKEGDKVEMEIMRPKGRKGKYKTVLLSAPAQKIKMVRKNQINLEKEMTDKQRATLKNWVGV